MTPIAVLAAFVPVVAGNGSSAARGKLLPDLPQHVEYAQQDLKQGKFVTALAHLDLVLMDKPVRYRIAFREVPDSLRPACRLAFKNALDMWQQALPGELTFREAAEGEPAELNVTYKPDVRQQGSSVAGLVNWTRRVAGRDSSFSGEIQLRTVQPDGSAMQVEHMTHTAAHEIGHVLGLDDSPFFGDIMGPLDLKHPVSRFDEPELEQLKAVRSEAQRIRQECVAKRH